MILQNNVGDCHRKKNEITLIFCPFLLMEASPRRENHLLKENSSRYNAVCIIPGDALLPLIQVALDLTTVHLMTEVTTASVKVIYDL